MNPGTLSGESRFRVAVTARCQELETAYRLTVAALFPEMDMTETA